MKNKYLENWMAKADNDLKVAEHEMKLKEKERVHEAICFHCQQAAEKYLKAYLVSRNIDFGKTHNLEYLLELCAKQDRDFKTVNAGDLSSYAVEIRYPDNFYIPNLKETKRVLP